MASLVESELGGQTRELNDKDAEIEELKEKNFALQTDYRNKARELLNCSRSLLDKDDQIDQLNRQIDSLQTLCGTIEKLQTEIVNLKSSVKEKDLQIVELQRHKSAQSDIEIRPEDNTERQSKIESFKACVIRNRIELAESRSLIENDLFKGCVKEKQFQIVDVIQMKQNFDYMSKQIDTLQSEVQTRTDGNTLLQREINYLKHCLVQKETELAESENKCKELEEFFNENVVDLPSEGMVHEGKTVITEQGDEEMPESKSTKDIQTETDLIFLSDDEEPCDPAKMKEKYERPDSTQRPIQEEEFKEVQRAVHNENPTKHLPKRPYSDEEINQIIYYIFNVCKPLEPNPRFSIPYFRILSKKLKEDNVCERNADSLYGTFKSIRVYYLYKNMRLHTAEHREIAVKAFKFSDCKRARKLIDQYDRARAPGITDEQIAQMESLYKKHVRDDVPKMPFKHFSPEEDKKMIDLIFNHISVDSPKKRRSEVYWKQIRDELMKHTNIKRRFLVCTTHFRGVLLPNLHKRKDLRTAEHRRIAVELYSLWWNDDKKEQYIRLYDSARPSRSTLKMYIKNPLYKST